MASMSCPDAAAWCCAAGIAEHGVEECDTHEAEECDAHEAEDCGTHEAEIVIHALVRHACALWCMHWFVICMCVLFVDRLEMRCVMSARKKSGRALLYARRPKCRKCPPSRRAGVENRPCCALCLFGVCSVVSFVCLASAPGRRRRASFYSLLHNLLSTARWRCWPPACTARGQRPTLTASTTEW